MSDGQGLEVPWTGFNTGPRVLSRSELERICLGLLGINLANVATEAAKILRPDMNASHRPAIIIYTATPLKLCFEADLQATLKGTRPEDPTSYIEARSVYLGQRNDMIVGRIAPWVAAAGSSASEPVQVPGIEYYYLTHALLVLAHKHGNLPGGDSALGPLGRIIDRLRVQPDTVVRLYALDTETQVFLLWLTRMSGVSRILIDANGPVVSDKWNSKAVLHPTVSSALSMPELALRSSPWDLLEQETSMTALSREFGILVPRFPGYTVERLSADVDDIRRQIVEAAGLLQRRHAINRGCFKPARGSTGARIVPGVDLTSQEQLCDLARRAGTTDEDYVLEAHADYLEASIAGRKLVLAPSAHIVDGMVAPGASLQILQGSVWRGNVFVDERVCEQVGISLSQYDTIRKSMEEFVAAFSEPGRDLGLVKGGIDFGLARVHGRFGDAALIGMQDLNLSSHGAEYLRAFLDGACAALGNAAPVYASTKVIRPLRTSDIVRLRQYTDTLDDQRYVRAISSVPGSWGLVGVGSRDAVDSFLSVLKLEHQLERDGLLHKRV